MRAQTFAFRPNELARIEKLPESDFAEWDAFIQRHKWGLVCHLSGWKRAVEETFGHIRGQILVLRSPESGAIVAGIPVYEVKSRFVGYRIVSIPFATLCDPLVSSRRQLEALVTHLSKPTDTRAPARISVWRAAKALNLSDTTVNNGFLHHFLVLDRPFETLVRGFSKSAVRQMVLRAQRSGIQVESHRPEAGLSSFYDLYCLTRHRLGLPAMPFRFFDSLYRHLGETVLLFHARKGEQILGSALAFKWKDMVSVECIGEKPHARKLGVSQLLWWEAIRRASEGGCTLFSFGRTHQFNKGLVEFKRRWGTQEEFLPTFVQPVPAGEVTYTANGTMTQICRRLIRFAPSSLYRCFSAVCYRHLG
jgi:CelD/BcsL family acetyltransferase involved in cellulose biosynthesis